MIIAKKRKTTKSKYNLEKYPSLTIKESDIVPLRSVMPNFRGNNYTIIHKTSKLNLDKENTLILQNNVFTTDDLENYIKDALKVVRKSECIYGKMKPRFEVCYTVDGNPYNYRSHYTTFFPEHVKLLLPTFNDVVNFYIDDNPYQKISTATDILYSSELYRGGSISPHKDDEMDWGCIVIFSLGQTRWLRIKDTEKNFWYNIQMNHNSVICMHGPSFQKRYTHQVDKLSEKEKKGTRLSLNVRFLKGKFNIDKIPTLNKIH